MGTSTARRENSVVTQIRPAPSAQGSGPHGRPPGSPGNNNGKNPKKSNPLLGLGFVVAALLLGYFAWKSGDGSSEKSAKTRDLSQIDNVVNKNLIMTNKKIELEQERARLENNSTEIPEVGEQILPRWKPQQVIGVDQSPDRNEENAVRDLSQPDDINVISPDTIIQSELADREKRHEYESKYKEEYARRFIENARAGGYEIELDDNFVVTKVRKIDEGGDGPGLFKNH